MAHVLRVEKVRAFGNRLASEAYIARATDRPAFRRAQADQAALFRTADAQRRAAMQELEPAALLQKCVVIPDKRRSRADPGSIIELRRSTMDPGASPG